ncbi:MAG: metallophosphoesterase [Prevotellaceae bacterium]|nr:metallophosphoesterase [Prevotellaceae bacterium]
MLLRLLVIFLLFLVIPAVILWWRFRSVLSTPKRRILFFLPNAVLIIAAVLLSLFETYSPANARLTGIFLVVFIAFSLVEVLCALLCLIGLSLKRIPHMLRLFTALGFVAAAAVVCIVAYGYFWGMDRLTVTYTDITHPDVPCGFEGYRIVFFSDLHLGTYGRDPHMPLKVIRTIEAQRPDIILFGGDLVNYHTNEIIPFLSELRQLHAPDGVYAVMGNHDYQLHREWESGDARSASVLRLQQLLRGVGWKMLLNDHRLLTHRGDTIALIGVENDGLPPFPQLGDLPKAQKGLPDTLSNGRPLFRILLTHDPTHWRRKVLPDTPIQLTLSGHTHASQLQIGPYSPSQCFFREWGGLYAYTPSGFSAARSAHRYLWVSKGIGGAMVPFRFGAWPEINVITLHSSTITSQP